MWGWQKISTFCIFTFWAPSSRIPLTFRIKMIPNAGIIYLYFCLLLDVGLGFLHCTDNSPKISVTPIRWSVCVCVCVYGGGVVLSNFLLVFSSCFCLFSKSCLTLLQLHGLQPARLLCPWNFPGNNTGKGCHFLLQEIFSIQGLNPHLLHYM